MTLFATAAMVAMLPSLRTSQRGLGLGRQLGRLVAPRIFGRRRAFARWAPGASISSLRFSNVYAEDAYAPVAQIQERPELRRMNLWSYVDDCGEACRLALENGPLGHEAYVIAAADTLMNVPTVELMRRHFPDVPLRDGLEGFASLLSSGKARRVLGYEARHSWRQHA